MNPIAIPANALETYANLRVLNIGPPPGVSDEDCGSVEALVGYTDDRALPVFPVMRTFWKLTDDDIEKLKSGAVLELDFFTTSMPMHNMAVYG